MVARSELKKLKRIVIGVGFEPTPPKRLVPETSALDRSAIQPIDQRAVEVARGYWIRPCRRVWNGSQTTHVFEPKKMPRLGIAPRLLRPQRKVLLLYYLGNRSALRPVVRCE